MKAARSLAMQLKVQYHKGNDRIIVVWAKRVIVLHYEALFTPF